MEDIWTLAKVEELEFAAASTLLAIKAKQQSIPSTEQFDDGSDSECDSEEDEADHATSRPTPRLAAGRHEKLVEKFLDRLAEVFSCVKSLPQSSNRQDSEHIAAAAWIKPDDGHPLTVIVAKNRGFLDDRNLKMLAKLEQWFRLVAITSHDRSAQTDKIWAGDGGLVEYSRDRLWYYISAVQRIEEPQDTTVAVHGDVPSQIADLQRLCRNIQHDSPVQQFSIVVNAAYDQRSTWKGRPVRTEHRKAIRTINMLGRLRAAYECFKSIALTFDDIRGVVMQPAALRQEVQQINVTRFKKLLQKLSGDLKLPKSLPKSKAANRYLNASSLHVHAEMQILVSLGKDPSWRRGAHAYIGVSKKLCFLCDQILQNYRPLAEQGTRRPSFKARQCHGKVYPLWTLPQCEDQPFISQLSLATAVLYTHRHVREKLQQQYRQLQLQPAIAESSAGVSSVGSFSADLALLRNKHLVNRRPQRPRSIAEEDQRSSRLGRKIKTAQVGLLPADGIEPSLVSIAFHELPTPANHKLVEYGWDYVPDFHNAWHVCQFDRRYLNIPSGDQFSSDWDGEYRLYWNENDALPENETIKALLGIEEVDPMRRFWYGDVFLMRYSEHPKTFKFNVHDLQLDVLQSRAALKRVFQNMWEKRFLETELEQDQYSEEHRAKSEADKYILWQRMWVIIRVRL